MEPSRNTWKLTKVGGSKGFVLAAKLKAIKMIFKRWQKKVKMEYSSLDIMEARLEAIELSAKTSGWNEGLRDQRCKVMAEIWTTLLKEERNWRQKARVKWLVEGDRNSSFFHMVCNSRRRRNFIDNISIRGDRCVGPTQVREGIFGFFKTQFESINGDRPRMEGIEFDKISEDSRKSLEKSFCVEKVRDAVNGCDGNKAPGPKGGWCPSCRGFP
ncbi:hypothetical protein Dsin_011704 [Dipteronia sinensis]|uniref:Reverse transcriptase n=1 Tax=Dipteronia sinensis TaxID=43782 RepID=A0AAE0E7H6_9ROSI|nr:hypothetical protein Dsin_011704 [Dipteronia sinensis]